MAIGSLLGSLFSSAGSNSGGGGDSGSGLGFIGRGIGAGGSIMDLFSAQNAREQEEAARIENERRAAADRAFIMDLYQQSRGSQGSAILPLYFGDFEKRAAADATGLYDAFNNYYGSPTSRINRFTTAASLTAPARQQAGEAVNDLFGGGFLRSATESAQPVYSARTAVGKTARAGYLSALADQLNRMKTADRARGFAGSGSFAQNRLLGASAAYNQQAAQAEAGAALDNALQQAMIEDEVRKMQIANANLPAQLAASNIATELLPGQAAAQSYANQMQPMDFFRIGNQVPYGAIPRTPDMPVIPSSNQLFWGALGQVLMSPSNSQNYQTSGYSQPSGTFGGAQIQPAGNTGYGGNNIDWSRYITVDGGPTVDYAPSTYDYYHPEYPSYGPN